MSKKLPETILLGSLEFRIQEHEGLISFVETNGFYGIHSQFTFERSEQCWYLRVQHSFEKAMMSKIVKAYKLVCDTYGGDFEQTK